MVIGIERDISQASSESVTLSSRSETQNTLLVCALTCSDRNQWGAGEASGINWLSRRFWSGSDSAAFVK